MEEVFVLMLIITSVVFLLSLFAWWWWEDTGQKKFQNALEKAKNIRSNRKERGLPLYERVARAYERKAEEALHSNRPSEAWLWEHEARKVREDWLKDMMEGKIL